MQRQKPKHEPQGAGLAGDLSVINALSMRGYEGPGRGFSPLISRKAANLPSSVIPTGVVSRIP